MRGSPDTPGSKRILALDGGGFRGIVGIAFSERLEALMGGGHADRPRLADYFDLIGGTSTGAITAAGVALGMEMTELKRLYVDLVRRPPQATRASAVGPVQR